MIRSGSLDSGVLLQLSDEFLQECRAMHVAAFHIPIYRISFKP